MNPTSKPYSMLPLPPAPHRPITHCRHIRPSVRPYVPVSIGRVRFVSPKPFGIYSWNFTDGCIISRRCVTTNKKYRSAYFVLLLLLLILFNRPALPPAPLSEIRAQAITPKLFGMYSWSFTYRAIRYVASNKGQSGYFNFSIISPCLKSMFGP